MSQSLNSRHDCISLCIMWIFDHILSSSCMWNHFSKFIRVFRDIADALCSIPSNFSIVIFQTIKNPRENLSFHHALRLINSMLRNIRQAQAHLPFKLRIGMRNQRRKIPHGFSIHNFLRRRIWMLGNFRKRLGRNPLKLNFWLLDADDEGRDGVLFDQVEGELFWVLGDAGDGPGGGFFHLRVEVGEAGDELLHGAGGNDWLG